MAKKVKAVPTSGIIVVRSVDLRVWRQFKQLADNQRPKAKLGSFLTETLLEKIEQNKPK